MSGLPLLVKAPAVAEDSRLKFARYLVSAACQSPSADNSQPWQFTWDGDCLLISFARDRGKNAFFGPDAHATLLSLGALVENIEQAAAAIGQRIEWHWSNEIDGDPYVGLSFGKDIFSGIFSDDLPLHRRHTNRFPFLKAPIPDPVLQRVSQCRQGRVRTLAISSCENRQALIRCARVASEARFCNRELHSWLIESLRMTPEAVDRGDGLDLATLNLPPGGSYFMRFISEWRRMKILNQFGVYKALAFTETQLLGTSPGLICIVGNSDFGGVIDAGRLLARVWIDLNANGYAVHPYYVITDQLLRLRAATIPDAMIERVNGISTELPSLLAMQPGEMLHMLLRVGLPSGNPPRSRRLPLHDVFLDVSASKAIANF